MRKPIILLFLTILCGITIYLSPLVPRLKIFDSAEHELFEDENEEEEEESDMAMAKQFGMWFQARAYPDPYYLNTKFMAGWRQAQALRNNQPLTRGMQSGLWNPIGPNNSPGGRILSIAIDPSNSNKIWAGSASGGLWKSVNAGNNWTPVITDQPVLGVTSIIINPSNTENIFAATGEVYRVDSTSGIANPGNTSFNVWKTRGTYSIGILRSDDGGITWSNVWSKTTSQLFGIQELKFDPSNSNIIYACTTDGLYRSTDAGIKWTQVFAATYVSDVVINGTTLVAAAGNLGNTSKGIFRSVDNGVNWVKITSGLPASFQGYIKFAWEPSEPTNIVASIGVSKTATVELYRSTNTGLSWTGLSGSDHCDYQYWFSHDVAINPSNTNRLIMMGVNTYQYTISTSAKGSVTGGIHSDVHDIKFDPSNAAVCYVACDGGVWKSTNATSATPGFSEKNNGLGATQFYASIGVSRSDPNLFIGGLQDNGVWMYNGVSWNQISWVGGDGAACAIDPSNDNNIIASKDAKGISRSTNRGAGGGNISTSWASVGDSRTGFVTPLAISNSTPSIAYAASDNWHVSTSGGTFTNSSLSSPSPGNYIEAYRKTAIALAISPVNSKKVFVSTSSFSQFDNDVDQLYSTGPPNVLKSLTGNTPFTSVKGSGATALPNRYIMDFAISKTFDDSVFVAVGGFGTPHIYATGDGGATWYPRGSGLPDVPFNAVMFDPINPKIIYAGGDLGVWVSPDRGLNWYDFNTGMWDATQVMDLEYTADYQILAATHGKGLFKSARFSGILPVKFLSFNGDVLSAGNLLHWEVAQSQNISHFEIERTDVANNFKTIAFVTNNGGNGYQYSDELNMNQSYYYRLKSVDLDGSISYSQVIYLRRSKSNEIRVLGNPFTSSIELGISMSQSSAVQINLYDASGILLRTTIEKFPSGQSYFSMNGLAYLPSGTYYLEMVLSNQRWKHKLLKK